MAKVIEKRKLKKGKASLKSALDSIEIVRQFPIKSRGMVKPVDSSWFKLIKSTHTHSTSK